MLKTAAVIFGIVFIIIGILGFVPAFAPEGMLLGIFMVGLYHNIVHLVSGVAALAVAGSAHAAKVYFMISGVVYALVLVLGLTTGNALGFLIPVNTADNLLHLVLAAAFLYLGFAVQPREARVEPATM